MADQKMAQVLGFAAGATRTRLRIFSDSFPAVQYPKHELFWVEKAQVGKSIRPGHAFVFINPPRGGGENVLVAFLKGYSFEKLGGPEPLVWEQSSAACESGVLFVAQPGFCFRIWTYKKRRGYTDWQVTSEGKLEEVLEQEAL